LRGTALFASFFIFSRVLYPLVLYVLVFSINYIKKKKREHNNIGGRPILLISAWKVVKAKMGKTGSVGTVGTA
jgi:hypothetical protein